MFLKGNIVTELADCKDVDVKNTIVYCARCSCILGNVDALGIAHLCNVRLMEFLPSEIRTKRDQLALFLKMREFSPKRTYPMDVFDLMDEPRFKKPKFEIRFIMRVGRDIHEERIFQQRRREEDSQFVMNDYESSFEDMDETTLDVTVYFRSVPNNTPDLANHSIHTPEGSPRYVTVDETNWSNDASNGSDWSDDEPTREFNFYDSPQLRSSTPNSEIVSISSGSTSITQNFDVITISSSCSPIGFEDHPNFRAISSTPIHGKS